MTMRKTIGLSLAVLIVSTTAWAKDAAHATQHHRNPSEKTRAAKAPAAASAGERQAIEQRRRPGRERTLARTDRRERSREDGARPLPPADRVIGSLHSIGPREIGKAAWYGAHRLGARTASGEPLDAIHATAAHRTLPLHTLVRVTNLGNGRSAICTINDRGPVSRSLLIDLSPRTADELDMRSAGIARVSIEPVAETAATAAAATTATMATTTSSSGAAH